MMEVISILFHKHVSEIYCMKKKKIKIDALSLIIYDYSYSINLRHIYIRYHSVEKGKSLLNSILWKKGLLEHQLDRKPNLKIFQDTYIKENWKFLNIEEKLFIWIWG